MRVALKPLLEANAAALDCIRRNEEGNSVSALNRYRRMKTAAPPIVVDGLKILDGLHRALVAEWRGQDTIEAIGK